MLRHLTIHNYTLVNHLDLDLQGGMTVVTGETGAGKSIMLDALSLTLGSRADSSLVAPGSDRTEILATFDVSGNPAASQWLLDRELGTEECILRRTLSRDGRSRAFINGVPSTLTDLSNLGNLIADIHSQHEHQSLLKPDTHRRLLDEYGNLTHLVNEVTVVARRHGDETSRLDALLSQTGEDSARLQLLHYQHQELTELALGTDEVALLEAEQKRLADAEQVLATCHQVAAICRDGDSEDIVTLLSRCIDDLAQVQEPAITEVIELLNTSRIQIEEAMVDLTGFSDRYEVNPEKLKDVEARLSAIYDIARKHRVTPDALATLTRDIESELASLTNAEQKITELQKAIETSRTRYREVAKRLSTARQGAAKQLQQAVTTRLTDLGMADTEFSVQFSPRQDSLLSPQGAETVEFLIRTQRKQPLRPLARVASGGELSRISLAIQVVAADTSQVPTLVFDEVDVGIGGAVAEVVGSLLHELGNSAQIICVTHLPQVAVQGDHHLLVAKRKAETEVSLLQEDERVSEIARMLGGIDMTDRTLAHAREMLSVAQSDSPGTSRTC